jgi:hypothetical protein
MMNAADEGPTRIVVYKIQIDDRGLMSESVAIPLDDAIALVQRMRMAFPPEKCVRFTITRHVEEIQ